MENFLVVHLQLSPLQPSQEIMVALLDNLGYDSFEETAKGLKAYILENEFNAEQLEAIPYLKHPEVTWSYQTEKLSAINWNEEWERNYEPVYVDKLLHIRAPFHKPEEDFKHVIEIEPKMSFGTGHHQTTRLMATQMFSVNFENLKVLDMGTGTGVLAILAEKLGAKEVLAIDNFEWAAENTQENASRNNCKNVRALLGDAKDLAQQKFDFVLANINRNVLLEDMAVYANTLSSKGGLLLSGFLEKDFDIINDHAQRLGFTLHSNITLKNWQCCHYIKD